MDTKTKFIISAIILLIAFESFGQDSLNHKTIFPTGISIGYGVGLVSVKDEYISKEKYSGTLPYFNIEWVRFHNKNGYRLEFEQRNATTIKNNNVSAKVQHFVFNQDFFYPVGNFSLFSKDVYAYLGPSLQYFYYDIDYNFVNPGTFILPKAFGNLGSFGINTTLVYHVNKKLSIEGFLRSNLFSVCGKLIDKDVYSNEPSPKLLSVFSATKFDFDFSVRYYLIKRVSVSLAYKFELSRIDKWDPYISASDNIIVSLNYKF